VPGRQNEAIRVNKLPGPKKRIFALSDLSRIHDPNAGGDLEVDLQAAGDGLYIFDRRENRLHFWPYAEIIDAGRSFVLAHQSHPDLRLTVADHAQYQAIAVRAPQLPQPPERLTSRKEEQRLLDTTVWSGMSGRTFFMILLGLLAISAIGTFLQ
jgi:hypothetical protein